MKYFNLLILFLFLQLTISATSKKDSTESIKSYRLSEPLKIDGVLNESVYENPAITKFIQKDPNEGDPITEKTEVWVSHDDDNIYFQRKIL